MSDICGEGAYSSVHINKLKEHFGDTIVITEINGKSNVVTFRSTAKSILQKFYQRPTQQDTEAEKKSIISTAARLIKSDIQSKETSKQFYASSYDLSSAECNLSYIPESLRLFLKGIFSEKDVDLKISAVGQAIIQAARPRVNICPLQIGLGIQMHHHFASKFLIDVLNSFGFCSSYSEVQRFELSAAANQGIDINGYSEGNSVQFIADNVDHNVRTLDGYNTFHGMGILAAVTPGVKQSISIPRINATSDDLKALCTINIDYYKPPITNKMSTMTFAELKNL
ncbi:unnamed protein product [Mytilus coruscus]|uniref:Uncharacterized protein n=1 Tax=Mytilus coruscus TaxID=42192 RepID=A0A6J8A7Y6_MYTCO|nr:unnamed protein product [Mytilus coruscus]